MRVSGRGRGGSGVRINITSGVISIVIAAVSNRNNPVRMATAGLLLATNVFELAINIGTVAGKDYEGK